MTITNMPEFFEYAFMVRALTAGVVVALTSPLIGMFLVLRRYSLMADALAHVALAGVAIGVLVGFFPPLIAFAVTVVSALFIEYLREKRRVSGEAALAMILSGGLAIAVTLFSFGKGLSASVLPYLFGSILTVSVADLFLIGGLGALVLIALLFFWKELMYVSFDEETARVQGVPVRFVNILLVVLTASTISVAMRVVGVLLTGALMVVPVLSAFQIGRSFRASAFYAVAIALISVFVGLVSSFYMNIAAGAAIVLASFCCFFIALLARTFVRK